MVVWITNVYKCITPAQNTRKKRYAMKYIVHTDPIAQLWEKNPERLPAHVQRALTTPPSGRADIPLNQYEELPCTNGVFIDKVPSSATEVDEYINNARFSYSKQKAQVIKAKHKLPLDNLAAFSIVFSSTLLPTILFTVAVVQENIDFALAALIPVLTLLIFINVYDLRNKGHATTTINPTNRMKEIEQQCLDVSQLGHHVPEQAWNIYLYDRDNYDEFVSMCENLLKVDADTTSKTREMKQEILDTFYEMSLMRQENTKREIDTRLAEIESLKRKTEVQERQLKDDIDTAQADALAEMMLDPLKADLRAMKKVYNKEVNA